MAKQSVPEVYPQVLALPIPRRPLFPGFYKAVVICNPAVLANMVNHIFMLSCSRKSADNDVNMDSDSVYPVGVCTDYQCIFCNWKRRQGRRTNALRSVECFIVM
jgi:Lon-like ATP-dependent protease